MSSGRAFRPDVQGLRAIAVLVVVADHFAGWPNGGFVGVDIFFVISGFLITGLLIREYESSGHISFKHFYVRRIKRIVPAATLVLGVTLCASFALLGFDRVKSICYDVMASFLFVGNWRFADEGVDYFQQDLPPSPVQHYWSLSVEEQFYFVWPWLLLGIMVIGVRLAWWRRTDVRRVSGTVIAAVTLVSLTWAFRETSNDPTYAYFSTFSRAWELGIGALIAIAGGRLAPSDGRLRLALAWIGLAGIVLSVFVVPETPGFPAPWALLPVLATALVLLSGVKSSAPAPFLLTNRPMRYVGDISYSLYLWHFPICILLLSVVAYHSLAYWTTGLVLMGTLSVASFHFLENRARNSDWFVRLPGARSPIPARGWYRFAGACTAIALVAAVSAYGVRALGPPAAEVPEVVLAGRTADNPVNCFGAAALDPAHDCSSVNDGGSTAPHPFDAPSDHGNYMCMSQFGAPMLNCTYGSESADARQVALVGDSHANHLLGGLVPQLEALNWQVTTFVGAGCKLHLQNAEQLGCKGALPGILDALNSGEFDLVLTSATRRGELATMEQYIGAMEPIVESGAHLVVIADGPEVTPELIQCVAKVGYTPSHDCGVPVDRAFASPDVAAQAAREVAGAVVIETRDLYCTEERCPATVGNALVYRDTASHVTASYAETMGPYLIDRILAAIEPAP